MWQHNDHPQSAYFLTGITDILSRTEMDIIKHILKKDLTSNTHHIIIYKLDNQIITVYTFSYRFSYWELIEQVTDGPIMTRNMM